MEPYQVEQVVNSLIQTIRYLTVVKEETTEIAQTADNSPHPSRIVKTTKYYLENR